MKLNSNHTLYKQADVSCSKPQLVLMLLDGAIRFTREAAVHLRAGRWAEKGVAVDSAYECLTELRHSLDRDQGGDAAQALDRMYDFLCTKLTVGNAARDADQFDQIAQALRVLRDGWAELFERLQSEGKLREDTAPAAAAL